MSWCSCADGLLFNVGLPQLFLFPRGELVWLSQGWGVWVWEALKRTKTSGTCSPSIPGHVVALFNIISSSILWVKYYYSHFADGKSKDQRLTTVTHSRGPEVWGLRLCSCHCPTQQPGSTGQCRSLCWFSALQKENCFVLSFCVASFRLFTG